MIKLFWDGLHFENLGKVKRTCLFGSAFFWLVLLVFLVLCYIAETRSTRLRATA